MSSNSLIQRIQKDLSNIYLRSSIDTIDDLVFQDTKFEYLISINKYLSSIIEEKIKHMSLFGDKLNSLKKHINILKRNKDESLETTMYSYEILLDIMITKAEQLSILQEKQNFILSMIDKKNQHIMNRSLDSSLDSSLEIIIVNH